MAVPSHATAPALELVSRWLTDDVAFRSEELNVVQKMAHAFKSLYASADPAVMQIYENARKGAPLVGAIMNTIQLSAGEADPDYDTMAKLMVGFSDKTNSDAWTEHIASVATNFNILYERKADECTAIQLLAWQAGEASQKPGKVWMECVTPAEVWNGVASQIERELEIEASDMEIIEINDVRTSQEMIECFLTEVDTSQATIREFRTKLGDSHACIPLLQQVDDIYNQNYDTVISISGVILAAEQQILDDLNIFVIRKKAQRAKLQNRMYLAREFMDDPGATREKILESVDSIVSLSPSMRALVARRRR